MGLRDRNYQFRTIVHFFQLENFSELFLTKEGTHFVVSLNEFGFHFGAPESGLFKYSILPISKICDLKNTKTERAIFSKTRTLQREVCYMIDEWEHINSILAVEFDIVSKALEKKINSQNQENQNHFFIKLNTRRNELATWCLETLCDFQEWINEVTKINLMKSEDSFS